MKTQSLHTLIGGAVVMGAIVFGFLLSGNGRDQVQEDSYQLQATFSKIDGIEIGSDVLIAGIPVGKVIGETMNPNNHQVTLDLQIKNEIQIPYDSSAQITSDGIFGSKYISVNIGGDFEYLENGDTFEFIRDAVIFEEIFEKIILIGEAGLEERKSAKSVTSPENNIFETEDSLFD